VSVAYLRDGEKGGLSARREAWLEDLELRLRLDPGEDRAAIVEGLRVLHADAVGAGDFGVARRAQMLIGCSASDRGEHTVAVRELERLVEKRLVSPLREPDVYLSLGRSLSALGRAEDSVLLLESCLDEVETSAPLDDATFVRFSTYLSYALVDAGDVRRAKKVLEAAMARPSDVDASSRVRLFYAQARLAWAECDWQHGRRYAERAIALLEVSEDVQDLIRMHLVKADIALLSGDLADAEISIQKAEARVDPGTESEDIALLRCQKALIAARQGRTGDALQLARDAVEMLRDDPTAQGRGFWALAEALAAAGQEDEAVVAFERAYARMSIHGRFLPQLLHAWVEALRKFQRFEEATELFLAALEDGVITDTRRPLVAATFEIRGKPQAKPFRDILDKAQLARSLHDGLAQELALILRSVHRLDASDPLVRRVTSAADRALFNLREAIRALNGDREETLTALHRVALETGEREGASVERRVDPTVEASFDQPVERTSPRR
jgi:tetratricopeptide (TPR) repeat protein